MALTKKQETIIKKWVVALRSGKYKQGKEKLHKQTKSGDRYCCLGVLCEMAVRAKVLSPPERDCTDEIYYYEMDEGELPEVVKQWAGIAGSCGEFEGGSLAEMNDEGRKFTTIAKLIESKPEGLFV
jgi:hypothetical protein